MIVARAELERLSGDEARDAAQREDGDGSEETVGRCLLDTEGHLRRSGYLPDRANPSWVRNFSR